VRKCDRATNRKRRIEDRFRARGGGAGARSRLIPTALEPDSPLVIAGLDPAIHHLNQKIFF